MVKYTDQLPAALQTEDADGQTIRQVVPAYQYMPSLMGERQCYYIVSVPGENAWVHGQSVKLQQQAEPTDKDLQVLQGKHPLGLGPMDAGDAPGQAPSSVLALVTGTDKNQSFKLHDVHEFYGLVEEAREAKDDMDADMPFGTVCLPRPTVLPRLHVIAHRPYKSKTGDTDLVATRAEIICRFAHDLFGGDVVAAEWLLVHLVSSIFHRSPGFTVGSLPLNMTFPKETTEAAKAAGVTLATASQVHDYLSNVLPRTLLLPLSISFLNSTVFTPVMSDSNGLQAGMLQLARGTQLIVDETGLSSGTLKGNGVLNVQALKSIVSHGKLPVGVPASVSAEGEVAEGEAPKEAKPELVLGWMETDVDANVLIYGDSAKSGILPVDCVVPVQIDTDPSHALNAMSISNDGSFEQRARDYFAKVKELSYATDDMSQFIVTDFSVSREFSRRSVGDALTLPDYEAIKRLMATEEDLAHLCNVARWMTVSFGGDKVATLTKDHWLRTKQLELHRRRRVAHAHPKVASAPTEQDPRVAGELRSPIGGLVA